MPSTSMPSDSIATRFDGRFTSGETAGSDEVDVRLEERGLAILRPGAAEPLIWPYKALASGEPLGSQAIDALLTYEHQPGATLYIQGSAFVRALSEHAPHLTPKKRYWQVAKFALLAVLCVGAVIFAVRWLDLSPAHAIATLLPDNVRVTMGQQVVKSMTKGRSACNGAKGRSALEKLSKRLSSASGSSAKFNIVVVNWDRLNAFATPGEQIVLTRELIANAKSPDELAAVIAHEMGHGIELHPETSLVRGIGLAAAAELLFGGGSGSLANVGIMLAQLSYSRDAEREADAQGLRILKEAGISPKGMIDFFDRAAKLDKRVKSDDGKGNNAESVEEGTSDFFSTHPSTKERISNVKNQPDYPATPALSKADWRHLKSICDDLPGPAGTKSKKKSDTGDN